MNLLYEMPRGTGEAVKAYGEAIYCVPCDIRDGRLAKDWLAVTDKYVLLLRDGAVSAKAAIEDIQDARCEAGND